MATAAASDRASHVDALTGVRALAAGWVVAYHLWLNAGHPALRIPGVGVDVSPLVSMGWLGVDIFFILSGFVLTWQVLNERRGAPFSPGSFWRDAGHFLRRRILRVYPAYLACLSVLLPLAWIGIYRTPPEMADIALHVAMFHNMVLRYVDTINGVFWSMPFEWQFYLVFPLLILPVLRGRARWLAVGAATVAAAMKIVSAWHGPGAEIAQLPWRIDEFVAGMAGAAFAVRMSGAAGRARMTWIATASLVAGAWTLGVHDPQWWQPGWLPLLRAGWIDLSVAALLVGLCGTMATASGGMLASRVAVWLGTISYSIYLWHVPTLELTRYALQTRYPAMPSAVVVASAVAAVLVVSAISFYLVERPFHSPSRTTSPRWRDAGWRSSVVALWVVALLAVAAVQRHAA